MFSPFWIKLDLVLGILYIRMYLGYYSIKRFFFFCHFLKNFVIFLILTLFVSFGGKTMVKLCFNKTHFL
ncbi:hypothetical protein HPG27_850 [Helicobacter pylori G27]|uniref:Uncharacterized protein n=1 Tax=Helicobacter pylori (strain G27) TaxID=563041 RepID=B5Z7Q6_HELPG|nr:hypothetical protein HPG27_850 [Helicobacter pylori G27]